MIQVTEPKKDDENGRHEEESKLHESAIGALVDLYEVVMRDFIMDSNLRCDVRNV